MYNTKGYELLTLDNVLAKVSTYDIFRYYVPNLVAPGQAFCSDLREDKNPSCVILIGNSGDAIYKDFSTGDSHSCTTYVRLKFDLTFQQALQKISDDLRLGLGMEDKNLVYAEALMFLHTRIPPKTTSSRIRIVSKKFTYEGLGYWKQYGITEKYLNFFEIKQLSGYYLNDTYIKCKDISFAYCFGDYKYKILVPNDPDWKWISNCGEIVQGYNQLPKTGKLLILSKSLKDVALLKVFGLNAVSAQNEGNDFPNNFIEGMKKRFKRIVLYYDNDEAGLKAAEKLSKKYSIQTVYNPLDIEKDASDVFKHRGSKYLKELLIKLFR